MYTETNQLIIDDENCFDIAEAIHAWLTLWHNGISSKEYECLCRSQFKPGPLWSETSVENENIYFDEINRIEPFDETFERLEEFLKAKGEQ